MRPIKAHIKNLKAHYGGNSDKIKLNGVSSTFKAVMTFDKGLDIPENPKLTLTDNNLFEIKKIEKSGQSVTVTMALKKNYSKFSELYKDVTEVPDDLDLNIENVTVNKNVKVGTKLKTVGDVNGMFTGEAVTESGNYQHFPHFWHLLPHWSLRYLYSPYLLVLLQHPNLSHSLLPYPISSCLR